MKEDPAPGLIPVLEDVHASLLGRTMAKRPLVSFYPYVDTKSTIRNRDGRLLLRVSDHLRDAPDNVLRGLFAILLCRLERIPESRADAGDVTAYHDWLHADRATARRRDSRTRRGRKHIDPIGDHRSLLESYLRVTMQMDLHLDDAPALSWSRTRSTRRFGHQDADHGCIVISRALDDAKVPEFVLDYVVYHELLHIAIPPRMGSGRKRIVHPKEFRDAEARYPHQKEAEAWLSRIARAG